MTRTIATLALAAFLAVTIAAPAQAADKRGPMTGTPTSSTIWVSPGK